MAPKPKFKPRPILTPTGMLMFNHLTTKSPRFPGGDPVFNFVLLMDNEKPLGAKASAEWKDMRAGIAEAIDAEWGAGKSQDAAFVGKLQLPIHDATEKSKYTGFVPGKVYISPWTKEAPRIDNLQRKAILDANDIWAGQLARAVVVFFPYDYSANSKGVGVMLNGVQIMKSDMPRMDGRTSGSNGPSAFPDDQEAGADADAEDQSPF
jgi:hypothetical protein